MSRSRIRPIRGRARSQEAIVGRQSQTQVTIKEPEGTNERSLTVDRFSYQSRKAPDDSSDLKNRPQTQSTPYFASVTALQRT
jgi:hypothetical protein